MMEEPFFVKINQKFSESAVKEGKPKKVALTAAMRQLLTILNTLIKNDELCNAEPNETCG